MSPKRAIQEHCDECLGFEGGKCTSPKCKLYPFSPFSEKRGKLRNLSKPRSEEFRQAARERMQKYWENRKLMESGGT